MKKIAFTTVTVVGSDITIVGTIAGDQEMSSPLTQTTVPNFPANNKLWSRAMRLSQAGMASLRNGAEDNVFLDMASIVKMMTAVEPTQTYAPKITEQPVDDACVASSTAATFEVTANSEIDFTYQWQYQKKASGTLTSDNINVADGATVTIGNKTYTYRTALTPTEGEVLIGANADASLLNLIRAINHTGTPDTDYKCAAAHTQVFADAAVTTHAITVRSIATGTTGNDYATTETSTHLLWAAATLTTGGDWASASGTVLGCAYTNGTTDTLTCTPTSAVMNGVAHRCVLTSAAGVTNSSEVILTIT